MKKFLLTYLIGISLLSNAQIVLELNPTNFPVTQPCGFTEFNSKLFYVGANATYGRELFSTDGTMTGNQLVKDIGTQYFPATNGFQIQSGQAADGKFAVFNGKIYFEANNEFSQNNFKLWSSDGTSAGTNVIAPSLVYGPVRYFKEFNGRLYFTALGFDTGYEVWSTDGTTAGTVLLKDINPTPNVGSVNLNNVGFDPSFTVFNNKLYFIANDGVHGNEIWSTDGTTSGTTMLKDINLGTAASPLEIDAFFPNNETYKFQPFLVYNNRMYFNAYSFGEFDIESESLFSTDGTEAGTVKFQVPLPANYTGQATANYLIRIQGLTVANNNLYIFCKSVLDGVAGTLDRGVWVTDGTMANSNSIQIFQNMYGINGFSEDAASGSMREFNGEYYFLADDVASGSVQFELWKLSPSTNTFTKIVANPDASSSCFVNGKLLISQVFDSKLYFIQNGSNPGIYSTDGTMSGTSFVARNSNKYNNVTALNSTQAMTQFPDQLKVFGNSLYFAASFDSSPSSLWRITNPALNIDLITKSNFQIYPNPTSSSLNIQMQTALENATISITSITGQTVFEKNNISGSNFNYDVSNLSNGMYVIEVSNGSETSRLKFIKN